MGRADFLVCPRCDYKRRLKEAKTRISSALVVACLKSGAEMQYNLRKGATPARQRQRFLESRTRELWEDRVVS